MNTYEQSYAGVGEMLRADFMVAAMRAEAEKVKTVAESIAPFDPTSTDGVHYKERFRVESGVREGKKPRAYGRVLNDDPAAFQIEYGTSDTPRHRTLGIAMHAAGD